MPRYFAALFLLSLLCLSPTPQSLAQPTLQGVAARKAKAARADSLAYARMLDRYVEAWVRANASDAYSIGRHEYDSLLIAPDEGYRTRLINFCQLWLDSLAGNRLGPHPARGQRMDYQIASQELRGYLYEVDTVRAWVWNPASYNACAAFSEILANTRLPLARRTAMLVRRAARVPAYYLAAQRNLYNPSSEHTALAISQNENAVAVFKELSDSLSKQLVGSISPEERQVLLTAEQAVRGYVAFLKALPKGNGRSFRLGAKLYGRRFALAIQAAAPAETIHRRALERKAYLHGQMARLTAQLWPRYFAGQPRPQDSLAAIRQMIDRLSLGHTTPDSFQAVIDGQIPQLAAFVRAKNLLYLDPSKPLVVRREPDYMAGVAGASISAPGPFDKEANTYYNVGSLAAYSKEEAESFLREYNRYTLQILNIHEAIPGHYAQLVYANQSPSLIKSLFGNGAMIEGWAVYAELMMLENGYAGPTPEMWLMYYKWNLRTTCNFLLDYGVHTQDMTEAQAMDLLSRQAFQQETEARGKWRRVQLTSVQLTSYFTGFSEIVALREELQKRQGPAFDLKAFHERFLSYGSSPIRLIHEAMVR